MESEEFVLKSVQAVQEYFLKKEEKLIMAYLEAILA